VSAVMHNTNSRASVATTAYHFDSPIIPIH